MLLTTWIRRQAKWRSTQQSKTRVILKDVIILLLFPVVVSAYLKKICKEFWNDENSEMIVSPKFYQK